MRFHCFGYRDLCCLSLIAVFLRLHAAHGNGGATTFATSTLGQQALHWFWFMGLGQTGVCHTLINPCLSVSVPFLSPNLLATAFLDSNIFLSYRCTFRWTAKVHKCIFSKKKTTTRYALCRNGELASESSSLRSRLDACIHLKTACVGVD